jgi:serine/threonine protein kinase
VDGPSLRRRLTEQRVLDVDETVRIALETAAGLSAVHESGLIHRDIKPDNILFDGRDRVQIADFGLAKDVEASSVLTQLGQTVGSVDYMAPEQIRGEATVDPRTDVYGLACVVWECLVGVPPFAGRGGMRAMWAHLYEEPENPLERRPDLPEELVWALMKGLEKEPAERPRSAAAFARILQAGA